MPERKRLPPDETERCARCFRAGVPVLPIVLHRETGELLCLFCHEEADGVVRHRIALKGDPEHVPIGPEHRLRLLRQDMRRHISPQHSCLVCRETFLSLLKSLTPPKRKPKRRKRRAVGAHNATKAT